MEEIQKLKAMFPGEINEDEISRDRADQILRLQKIIKKQDELRILKNAEQSEDCPYDIVQSFRFTTFDEATGKIKSYPVFYIRETKFSPSKRVSFALGIEFIKLKKCTLTGDLQVWLMENGYGEVVKDLLHS